MRGKWASGATEGTQPFASSKQRGLRKEWSGDFGVRNGGGKTSDPSRR